ncbi:MAG: response regulator [Bacteroidota bacterium]|jgi:two-component system, cell cycle response regulator DivK
MFKILIAEDDEVNRYFISFLLRALSKDILTAVNGIEAVNISKANPDLSLVLMDINMPEMDGSQAMKEIRKIRPKLPMIAVTAYGINFDNENLLEAGFDDYLAKPYTRDQLLGKILKHL